MKTAVKLLEVILRMRSENSETQMVKSLADVRGLKFSAGGSVCIEKCDAEIAQNKEKVWMQSFNIRAKCLQDHIASMVHTCISKKICALQHSK